VGAHPLDEAQSEHDPIDEIRDFVVATAYEDLPTEIVEQSKRLIVDGVAAGVLGTATAVAPAFESSMLPIGPSAEATVWGRPDRASAFVATMLNASHIDATELGEGVSRAVVHTSSTVVPAALAIGERQVSTGRDLIRAVALGSEVLIRMGYSMARDPSLPADDTRGDSAVAMAHGWKTAALFAPVGSATATTILLGNDRLAGDAIRAGVNLCPAASFAMVRDGASIKGAAMGCGAAAGVLAADLVAHGVTGIANVIDDWMALLVPTFDPSMLTARLGTHWELGYVLYKHFATIGPLFAPLEAVFAMLEREPAFDPADVEDVLVEGYSRTVEIPQREQPSTETGARGNLGYCIAHALITRRRDAFFLSAFVPAAYRDSTTWELAKRVRAQVNSEYDALYPHHAAKAKVVVKLRDGRVLEAVADRAAISRYHYPTRDELEEKFLLATRGIMDPDRARRFMDRIWALEQIDDVRAVSDPLRWRDDCCPAD
jgi:2-methylcitrate dehydratase PrpD